VSTAATNSPMAQAALGAAVSTDALTLVGVFPSACSAITPVATGASRSALATAQAFRANRDVG
jgi:hypothetical protein